MFSPPLLGRGYGDADRRSGRLAGRSQTWRMVRRWNLAMLPVVAMGGLHQHMFRCQGKGCMRRTMNRGCAGRATRAVIMPTMSRIPVLSQDVATRNARPFLKWAGGKQQLLGQYAEHFPPTFNRYIEPFLGGGAVFFHLWNAGRLRGEVLLFDNNDELINVYRVVRDSVKNLIEALRDHKLNHGKDHYYSVRELDRNGHEPDPVERAARTLYLNKTCYNGLFRVNSKGQFNVPMGSYRNPHILDEAGLMAARDALQGATIEKRDFRELPGLARPRDFVYFDPPYWPVSKTSSFTGYTVGMFASRDQHDLAQVFAALASTGCLCMLSNSNRVEVRRLYAKYPRHKIQASRAINSNPAGRGRVRELLITSYDLAKNG